MSEVNNLDKSIVITVTLSDDKMKAYLTLNKTPMFMDDEKPEASDILDALSAKNVVYGISQDTISKICDDPVFGREYEVAEGKKVKEGVTGEYEFFFNSNFSKQPKELPDGSVDYMSVKVIETVAKGDKIAVYRPAIQGEDGMNVLGKTIIAKKVRDLPPISGKGFTRSEDGNTYIADIAGKIEKPNGENKITISPVYEVNETVGIEIGDIEFAGDVIIHAGVTNGVKVQAKGNITIDGLVENCTITAFGDIVLLKGVKGSERTVINAKGNITAEYIEYSEITAGGDITADVIFKSEVKCDGLINLAGKRKSIVGGRISAVEGMRVGNVGNEFGVITEVNVGVSADRRQTLLIQEKKVEALETHLNSVIDGLNKLDKILKQQNDSKAKQDPRKVQLLRAKFHEEAVLMDETVKLSDMRNLLERGRRAKVFAEKKVYSGSTICVNGAKLIIKDTMEQVEFRFLKGKVIVDKLSNEEIGK